MALPFMTVRDQSGKMKRNTEQTVLTLLAAIRSGVPVAVSCSGTEAEQPFWRPELGDTSTNLHKTRIAGEIRPTPSPATKCLWAAWRCDKPTPPIQPKAHDCWFGRRFNQYSVFKEQIQHATWVTL